MRGFTLVEVIVSVLIIGGVMVAVMNTVGATAVTRRLDADRARGDALAWDMLDEIMTMAYEDPGDADAGFGNGADETSRSLFDDVDDYESWEASPPEQRNGVAIGGFDGWTRTVKVVWVDAGTPDTDQGSETRLKRITVIVKNGDRIVSTISTLRGAARDELR